MCYTWICINLTRPFQNIMAFCLCGRVTGLYILTTSYILTSRTFILQLRTIPIRTSFWSQCTVHPTKYAHSSFPYGTLLINVSYLPIFAMVVSLARFALLWWTWCKLCRLHPGRITQTGLPPPFNGWHVSFRSTGNKVILALSWKKIGEIFYWTTGCEHINTSCNLRFPKKNVG